MRNKLKKKLKIKKCYRPTVRVRLEVTVIEKKCIPNKIFNQKNI